MDHRYIIVGAGPGGMQVGCFPQQEGRDRVVPERNASAGSSFGQHPPHRELISIDKRYDYAEEDRLDPGHDRNSPVSVDPEMRFTRYPDELFPHANPPGTLGLTRECGCTIPPHRVEVLQRRAPLRRHPAAARPRHRASRGDLRGRVPRVVARGDRSLARRAAGRARDGVGLPPAVLIRAERA